MALILPIRYIHPMKPRVYVETSVFSYLTARESSSLVGATWGWLCLLSVPPKNLQEMTMNDEIIADLRATKERLAADANFDIKTLIERIRSEERVSAAQGRVVLQPPPSNTALSEFQQIRFARH